MRLILVESKPTLRDIIGQYTASWHVHCDMARDGAEFDADMWTDEAVRTSVHWAEVRELAEAVLEQFGSTADQ